MTLGDSTPPDSTPERELLVWEHQQLKESLARGLAQSAAGETVDHCSEGDCGLARTP